MLRIGHCNSSKIPFYRCIVMGFLCLIIRLNLNLCMQLFLLHLGNYFAIGNLKALS